MVGENGIMTVKLLDNTLLVKLLYFKQEGNEEYVLMDTGGLLYLLRHFASFLYRLKKGILKLAITEQIIREIDEHLTKSLGKKRSKDESIAGVQKGMRNLYMILKGNEIRKIADPELPKKVQSSYERYGEDMRLVYVLFEGGFKGIATQDGRLAEKIPKEKLVPPQQLLK